MAVISFFAAYRCCRGDGWRRAAVRLADAVGWTVLVCWTPSLIASAVARDTVWIALGVLTVATAIFGREPGGNSTTVSALNFLVLQWLGVRLSPPMPVLTVRMPPDVDFAELRKRLEEIRARGSTAALRSVPPEQIATGPGRWHLARWVWPLTGWWSPVRWIARRP